MKNIPLSDISYPKNPRLKLCYRIMRISIFLLYFCIFSLMAENGNSQNVKVTIHQHNVSLESILEEIESQTEYLFLYQEGINVDTQKSIRVNNKAVSDVLSMLLHGTSITYKMEGKHIILAKEEELQLPSGQRIINGKITDESNEPMIGVTVLVKGAKQGVITDVDGNFSISVNTGDVLTCSYIGYISQSVKITTASRQLHITMQEDNKMLDEVVVVGYGSMRKKDLTGSVSSLNAEKLEKESPTSIQDLLRGGIPGLNIGIDGSAKGGGSIQVRGQRSLTAGNDPLLVLDGIIFSGELSEINPMDIERIDVLKDASSAAIYGAKSANGVILISTKKGKDGKPVVRFDASIGFATMGANRRVYNADGYLQFRSDYYNSSSNFATPGRYMKPTQENLSKYGITLDEWRSYDGLSGTEEDIWLQRIGLTDLERDNYLAGKTYDWYDNAFQTGIRQNYNASLSGSGEKVSYYWSLGYLNSTGLVAGNEYKTIRSNLKLDAKVTSFLDMGLNLNFQNRTDGDFTKEWEAEIIRNSPFALAYNEDGDPIRNPMGETGMNQGWNYDFNRQYMSLDKGSTVFNGTMYAKIKLPYNISYQVNFSPRSRWFRDRYHESSQNPNWSDNGKVIREQTQYFSWQLDNMVKWDYTFAEKHKLNVTLLQNAEMQQSWKDRMTGRNLLPTDALGFHYINGANMTKSLMETYDEKMTADALMARLFYSYADKYMITASIRRDGYSAFGKSNPRATFPSLALAWSFADEKFFKWEPLNYGKLRISWGQNGNRDIGKYEAISNMTTGAGKYPYISPNGVVNELSQLYVERMANHGLKWETTSSWNAAIDFGFMNNRINGSIEYYYMPTTDLIMSQGLPSVSGFKNVITNLGEVINKGVEVTLNTLNVTTKDFDWSSAFTFSLNRNRINHLYYEYENTLDANGHITGTKEIDDISNGWFIDQPIGAIWNYNVIGIWQENERDEAAKYGLKPGDAKIKDNYDVDSHKYTNEDKEFLGQTTPKFRWTFRNDFTFFQDFSLSFNIYSYWGHKEATTEYMNNSKTNGWSYDRTNTYVRKYWTPENPSNKYARLNSTNPQNVNPPLIMDKSFIRLDNISFSWNVPQKHLKSLGIPSLKLYGSVRNVAVWTKEWEYWDPEITNAPSPRTFTFGVSLTL